MTNAQMPDEMFIEARWKIEGNPLQSSQELLAAALVREAALALLLQGKTPTENDVFVFSSEVAGKELMKDKLLSQAIEVFTVRLFNGPFQVGPN